MENKTFILDRESNTISELKYEENSNERVFSLFKKEGWDDKGKRIEVIFKNPNNYVIIKDTFGNGIEMSFDTLISLKEVIDHVNDIKDVNIFSQTVSFK